MRLRLIPYQLPFARPVETARGRFHQREGYWVHWPDSSSPGWGEIAPWPGFGADIPAIDGDCAQLRGLELSEPESIDDIDDLVANCGLYTSEVRSGLSTCLLDRLCRRQGTSLALALSPTPVSTLDVGMLALTAEDAFGSIQRGFRTLKVKVGAEAWEQDVDRIARIRALSTQVSLRVDANRAWSLETAHRVLAKLAPLRIEFMEEPLQHPTPEAFRALRVHGVPLAIDETLTTNPVSDWSAPDIVDVWVMKPGFLGGPRAAYERGLDALRKGIGVTIGTAFDSAVGRAAAMHVASALGLGRACGLSSPLAKDVADLGPITAGALAIPAGPGLGIEVRLP